MTLSEFDDSKQATFITAIASAAGVSNADVTIVSVESISGARRRGEISVARRRLLAPGIRIDMSVMAANQNAANALRQKLTDTVINTKLQQAGLPAATILDARTAAILEVPQTPASAGSTTGGAAAAANGGSGGMLPAIIGSVALYVVLLAV